MNSIIITLTGLIIIGSTIGGCTTQQYRVSAIHSGNGASQEITNGSTFTVVSADAAFISDSIDDGKSKRPSNERTAAKLLNSLMAGLDSSEDRHRQMKDILRTEVEKTLEWVGFRREPSESNRSKFDVKATAESSIQSYRAIEGIFEERDTGVTHTVCAGDIISFCLSSPVTNSVKVGEREVTRYYRRTRLVVKWENAGIVAKSIEVSTTDESCDFERRMRILAGEGLRQALRNPAQKDLLVRIPQGYCG